MQRLVLDKLFTAANGKNDGIVTFDVTFAATAAEAVATLEAPKCVQFSIILLDMMLPDLNGYDLLPKIRALVGESVAILVASLHTQIELVQLCVSRGADAFLVKPLGSDEAGSLRRLRVPHRHRASRTAPRNRRRPPLRCGTSGSLSRGSRAPAARTRLTLQRRRWRRTRRAPLCGTARCCLVPRLRAPLLAPWRTRCASAAAAARRGRAQTPTSRAALTHRTEGRGSIRCTDPSYRGRQRRTMRLAPRSKRVSARPLPSQPHPSEAARCALGATCGALRVGESRQAGRRGLQTAVRPDPAALVQTTTRVLCGGVFACAVGLYVSLVPVCALPSRRCLTTLPLTPSPRRSPFLFCVTVSVCAYCYWLLRCCWLLQRFVP